MTNRKIVWRQVIEYHPRTGYRFIPGIKARIDSAEGGYLIQVNDSGFRCNHNFEQNKKPGSQRILLFGDSFTAGDGVSNEKRYGDILEQEIPNLEVYNFGLPATGTDQQYLAYKEYASGIDHDLLIIAIYLENIKRNVSHYRRFKNEKDEISLFAKPYFELEDGKLLLKNVPVPKQPIDESNMTYVQKKKIFRGIPHPAFALLIGKIGRLAKKIGVKNNYIQKIFTYPPSPEYKSPRNPAWVLMSAILEEWISNHPTPVLLIIIPPFQYIQGIVNPKPYQARFHELASKSKCTFYDPLPDLLRYPIEEREKFKLQDYHFSPVAHSALAASIAPIVRLLLDKTNP
jgi:hypothetical protein